MPMWPSPGASLHPATPFTFSASRMHRVIRLSPRHCERSEAIQSYHAKKGWIASSRSLSSGAHSRDPLGPRNDAGRSTRRRKARIVAGAGRRDREAAVGIFVQLVAQRPDRNAENVGGMGAVAEAVLQRLQDQV